MDARPQKPALGVVLVALLILLFLLLPAAGS
jgi:hypothetical protein